MATVKAVVLVDGYRYRETFGDRDAPVLEAGKGDEIEVSQEEFDRGAAMEPVALAKPRSDAAKAARADEPPPAEEPGV